MKKLFILTMLWCLNAPTFACLNDSGRTLDGAVVGIHPSRSYRAMMLYAQSPMFKEKWLQRKHRFEHHSMTTADSVEAASDARMLEKNAVKGWEYESDYAIALLYLGEVEKAIGIYNKLLEKFPNTYSLHANLGTAYELAGILDKSLFHLKKSVEIDPISHLGSEWVHLKILEAKIAMQKQPDWFQKQNVLPLDFGTAKIPKSALSKDSLKNLRHEVGFQLEERIQFIRPTDSIMGELFFRLADLTSMTEDVARSVPLYKLAAEYGVKNRALLDLRLAFVEEQARKYKLVVESDAETIIEHRQKVATFEMQQHKEKIVKEAEAYDDKLYQILLGGMLGLVGVLIWLFRR
jgi:tetratricopeptide (TPR) repeat protein